MKRHFTVIFIGLLGVIVYIFFLAKPPEQSPSTPLLDSKTSPEATFVANEVNNEKITTQMDKTKEPFSPEPSSPEPSSPEPFSPEPSSPVTQPLLKDRATLLSQGQILSPVPGAVVTRRQLLTGSIANFDARQHYFLIIQSQHFGQIHYPQAELLSADWETTGTYGSVNQKYGYRYDTFVVQTSEAETAQIMTDSINRGKGLAELPPETTIITDKVTVICCQ
jgi:hypothetical protein